jgi:hypothetical protein
MKSPRPEWTAYRFAASSDFEPFFKRLLNHELDAVIQNAGDVQETIQSASIHWSKAEWVLTIGGSDENYEFEFPLFERFSGSDWREFVGNDSTRTRIDSILSRIRDSARRYIHGQGGRNIDFYGRLGSAINPDFTKIPADIIDLFEVENIHNGVLICKETNERIFSLYVCDSGNDTSGKYDNNSGSTRGYQEADLPLLVEMEQLIKKDGKSAWAAAGEVAAKAKGGGTELSKQHRLFGRWKSTGN